MTWQDWLSIVAVILAAGALWLGVVLYRRIHRTGGRGPDTGPPSSSSDETPTRDLVAFVVNPTKAGSAELRDAAVRACASRYLPEPLWLTTSAEDPGVGQTREAIAAGATTVVAAGGDGTVRAVAEALVGTDIAMGIVPLGTGNLLARNLDLPLTKTDELLRIALTGSPRAIDVGWLSLDATPPDDDDGIGTRRAPGDHLFLVIAGLGFDAALVESTDEGLKDRVGWIAYFVAGARQINTKRFRLGVQLDGRSSVTIRVRSLLIGNCGKLPGGIQLLPDAKIDDGWLDIAAIDVRGGIAGWVQLIGELALQGVGLRNELPGKIGRIDHVRGRTLRIVAERPVQLQIDGEVLGPALELAAWIDPGALQVRAP